LAYVQRANEVLEGLSDYWPLTLRQVYYQLVAAGDIENNLKQYSKLSRMLAKARLEGLVSWDAIEDRSRRTLGSAGWSDKSHFVRDELERFLNGYRRDRLQSQAVVLELWTEKDTLAPVLHGAAFAYCVTVVVARGYSSVSYVHECRKRVEHNTARGKRTVLLYFGDLDPSGWNMLPSMMETLQDEMGLGGQVEGRRCALTLEQIEEYALPRNPDALKLTDTRAKKYIEQFGNVAVELDALPPATLEWLVRQGIEENLDLSKYREEIVRETVERDALSALRKQVDEFVKENLEW